VQGSNVEESLFAEAFEAAGEAVAKTFRPLVPVASHVYPAFEVSLKSILPGTGSLAVPPVVIKKVPIPAVALFLNNNLVALAATEEAATKFCVIPESFEMPTPLRVSVKPDLAVMVKLLAPGAKVIPSTIVFAELETAVVFETANVAVSADPFGTVIGVQLLAVFQLPEAGSGSHVALPACAMLASSMSKPQMTMRETAKEE